MVSLLLVLAAAAGAAAPVPTVGKDTGDWPQFLGPTRDGVYHGEALAESWPPDGPKLIWKKEVGEGFSAPVAAGGRLIVFHRRGDQEVLQCFDAANGSETWSFSYPTAYQDDYGRGEGPRGTPAVAAGRVYAFGAEGVLSAVDLTTGAKIWSADTTAMFKVKKGFFGAACSPLVEGDRVLMTLGGQDGAGLAAFDAATGAVRWKATGDRASYSSPVAATIGGKRHALFLTRSNLTDVDPATGEVRFQFPFPARIEASVHAATPLVVDDLVFISSSYQAGAVLLRVRENGPEKVWSSDEALSNHYANSVHHQGHLYGFDGRQEASPSLRCVELKTGKVRWSEDRFGSGTVTLAGTRLLILTESGELILAPASAEGFKPLARAKALGGTVRAYPALAGGRLYARSETTLVCLDLRKGG